MKKTLTIFIALVLPMAVLGQSPGGVATDLSVWYKADNGVTTNATKQVTQWNSSSGTNVPLTPSGTPVLPYNDQTTYTSTWNFNPTVTFNGTANYLRNTTTAYLTSIGSVHYIVVARGTNRNTAAQSLFAIAGNDDGFFYSGASGNTAFPAIGNNFNSAAAAIASPDDFGIYSAILPKTVVQGTQRGFYNALKKNYTAPYPITGATYTLPTTGAYMGADGAGDYFSGDIAEVIIYHSPVGNDIPDADLEKIHSYLAVKYGITLTSTQNYLSSSGQILWNASLNTGYTSNIAGIGRDAAGLDQKQSRSANSGKQLLISTTGLANTNAANSTSLSTGQYLIWGDNGLQKNLSVAISGITGVNYRFASIWKVQNTGSVGTVRMAWPAGINALRLIQSSDAVFDGTDTVTDMSVNTQTVNGVTYNYADITLSDGQFFTLAGLEYTPGGVKTAAWYRADAVSTLFSDAGGTNVTNAATIQQWNEFNNKPFPLSQATATLRPEFSNATTLVNFNPTVNYTTSAKWLQYDGNALGNIIDRSTGALFSAGNTTGTTAFFGFGISGASNTMDDPGLYNFTGNKFLFYPVIGDYDPQSTNTLNGPYIGGGTWQNSAGVAGNNAVDITLNGYHQTYNTGISNVTMVTGRNALMAGGAETSVAFQQNEMIVFPNKLTDTEISKVESYLAIKYGHTLSKEQNRNYLSSAGTVVWDGSTLDYYNNVFGIARDNISALYQKQSKSINDGQKLIIGAGNSLADTNAGNTNTLTEGQFLMTGDNGLKQSLTTPLVYTAGSNGTANFRFESIWKAHNSGNVGMVTVAWPKGVNNLYLVQSPDAVFDATDTFTPMVTEVTVNGVVYNTANVTLGNGQFFTFAGFAQAPGGVVGPDFWVKSDDTGTIATAWKDNSINADDIPNVGGMTLSAADRGHNFHPYTTGYTTSKYFYNTTSLMNATNGELPNTNTSIFSAVRPTTANGTGRITGIDDDAGNAAEPGMSIAAGDPRQYEWFNTTTSTDFSTDFNAGVSNIFSAIANNAVANGGTSASAGGEKILGLNGTYETTPFTGTNKFQIYGRNLRVGHGTWDAAGPFPGDIMEVVWYKRTLTANEQSRVNSYLAVKNGVTLNENYLATNSNVVWDRTINNGYNNNIFGIAKDDFTGLHQKQAGSVNSGQQLVISTTGLADNNVANSTGLVSDMQYLMTGDNGLKQGLALPLAYTAGTNGATNYRFESVWKVQNNNSVGTVSVAWPKGLKNLYLVQSPDAVFDATDTFTPMVTEVTVNGTVYNTANVTLGNGQFFTFAGLGNAPGGVANGLSYWYRADKNVANTGAATDVTGWTDVWNGTTVAQRVTNALPKYAQGAANYFNFNPGINFTAITQTLGNVATQTVTNTSNDIFTVTKEGMTAPSSPNPHFLSIGMDNTTTNIDNWDYMGMYPTTNVIERRVVGGATQMVNSGLIYSTTIPSIMYNTFTNTSLSRGLNGAANTNPVNYTGVGLALGGHIFGDTRWTGNTSDNGGFIGNLGETIIYGAGNLTTTERRKVDSYLAIKYGITLGRVGTDHYLNTDGNIVWNGATNATYNNNIFGVSRDDIEIFEQKVSKSVNAGTILTIATTNDFVNPNQEAARTGFANDKTYFLLGDNNVTTTALSSITVNGFTGGSRIPKIWLAQRSNTSGTMYFGADLSSYGTGFGSGDPVKMIIADDAAFTTNVVYVNGTYDATTGKWVHSHNFDSENANRYITYATVDEVSCTITGCNDNTYLNAVNPNTIEYDNLIASDDAIMAKEKDGTFKIWGYRTGPTSIPSNVNVPIDLLVPTAITPANGFNYTGTPLKVALAGGIATSSSLLLTTDGLYGWGNKMVPYTKTTNNTTPVFGKITVDGKADGLPPGVSPTNVKMLFQTYQSLTIVTCSGAVWTMNGYAGSPGDIYHYGDGMQVNPTNNEIWHRVKVSATETLDNVVAVRGASISKFALTSNGKLYTWGLRTLIGNGTDAVGGTNRAFATEVVVPNGITPKMIGMTETGSANGHTYYLLATSGKLFAMGENGSKQLGDGTQIDSNVWKEVTATSAGHTLGGNIVWISPGEHGRTTSPSMNALTSDKKQWGWGDSESYKLGEPNSANGYDPIYMPGNTTNTNGLGLNDEVIAVETGGVFTINYKNSNPNFGFVGQSNYGTIGNGTTGLPSFQKYTYNTAVLDLCMLAPLAGVCYKPGILTGTTLDTKAGITALNRAGTGSDNWPMVRKGGWLALESKTKAFVPNRVAFSGGNPVGIAPANFVEGMMVYDTTNKCMKMYTLKEGDASMAWHCISTQACPD